MSTMTLSAKGGGDFFRLRFWAGALLMLGMFLMLGVGQASAAPLAGTSIGNQASATYTDFTNVSRITVSNLVSTVVQPVGSATLTLSQTKVGAPGQPIAFSHTITNNGNAPDTFPISATAPTGALSVTPLFYIDANCDGVADNSTSITSVGPIAAGAQACFVAQGTLNSSGATSTFNVVTGVSSLAVAALTNTDTVSISNAGVINISKSISSATGAAGATPVTYTLTYRNTGTQPVFGLVIADALQSGVAFAAAPNIKLNGAAATASGAVIGSTPNRYNIAISTDQRKIVAVLERVDPNTQGTLTFDTTQNGPGPINNNQADFCYLDGSSGASPYVPGTPPGTIQPTVAANATVANACTTIIGTGASGNGSGVLTAAGTAAGTYVTTVLDPNVVSATATNPNTTNTVPFYIQTTAGAIGSLIMNNGFAGGAGGNGVAGTGLPVDGNNPVAVATATGNDINAVAAAAQGTVVTFGNWVWNTGAVSDAFNVTAPANNFPAGTSFLFFRADGNTPLTDSDGDGVVDTGPIGGTSSGTCQSGSPNGTASAATPCGYRVMVRAILPPTAFGGPFDVVIQAKSSLTPSAVNSVADRLTVISGSQVDLRNYRSTTTVITGGGNNTPAAGCAFQDLAPSQGTCSTFSTTLTGGTGQTAAGEASPVEAIGANPGAQVKFKLDVYNMGPVADSFDLSYNGTSGAYTTAAAFTTPQSLPSGFQVRFFFDTAPFDCSTVNTVSGQQISNTGVIQPSTTVPKAICAVVDIPSNAVGAVHDLYFRVLSPTTWVSGNFTTSSADVIRDRLYINTTRSVTITPNNAGQIFPGGSISYCHTVTNTGNVPETGVTIGGAVNSLSGATPAWPGTATYYLDGDHNCQLSVAESAAGLAIGAGGTSIATLNIGAGASVNYIVVVQAPTGATAGQTNVTTLTVTPTGTIGGVTAPAAVSATDSTTVVIGQVSLVKSQLVDTTCTNANFGAGTAPAGFLQTQQNVNPGQCIIYQVVATNIGTQSVSLVKIFDTTPPNTTCLGTPYAFNGAAVLGVNTSPAASACVLATTATASFDTTAISLAPASTATLYFRVRVNP